jgi:hypothetical protein
MVMWGIKNFLFDAESKKVNLPECVKIDPKKGCGLKCDEKLTTKPLFKVELILIQNISVWVHFVTEVS